MTRLYELKQYDVFTIVSSVCGISDEIVIDKYALNYCRPSINKQNGELEIVDNIENENFMLRPFLRDVFNEKDGITLIVSKTKDTVYNKDDEDRVIERYLIEIGK